jgi:hypothetical protein
VALKIRANLKQIPTGAASLHPGKEVKGALGVRTRCSFAQVLKHTLPRDAENTGQPGLSAVPGQLRPRRHDQLVPQWSLSSGTKRGAHAPASSLPIMSTGGFSRRFGCTDQELYTG